MLLEMKGVTKYFGPVKALDSVDFAVSAGEIHGLLGENGAGKSTLMNILSGAIPASAGDIRFDGQVIDDMTTRKSVGLGIRFIHQELNLFNHLTVYENLFLNQEFTGRFGFLAKKRMIQKAGDVLKDMNLNIDPKELVGNLDTSRKQLVEIAKALLYESKLIIMDEPTTALTNKEIDNLFEIMRTLKGQGVSLVYISHKMPELFAICDRYTVLRDGKLVQSGAFCDINERIATELLVGRSIVDGQMEKAPVTSEVVFEAKNLSCTGYFSSISFDLKKGEVLVITGLHGDGRGELSEALFGARRLSGGEISLSGKKVNTRSIVNVMKSGVGMVPRNRKERSIIKDMTILDNLSIATFVAKHRRIFVRANEERTRFNKYKKTLDIKSSDPTNVITSLSGGNQQKVIIGRWMDLDSDVYILDNPTQGIDVGAKFEIYKLIGEMANSGKSLIVFSSEFPEIYRIADRALVMYKGGIAGELPRDKLTEVNVMFLATGSLGEEKHA